MSPIVEQPEKYFSRFIRRDDPLLRELESEAQSEKIPIVGPLVGELLFILARALRAQAVLELGTATGYSAIYLARACALNQGLLTTLEIDPGLVRLSVGIENIEDLIADLEQALKD